MKKILTLLAVAATSLAVLAPSTSQAYDGHGHGSSSRSFSHSCGACRAPVYRQRVVIGRDRHGCLQYGYRTVSHSCRSSYGRGHDHGHSSHGHSSHGSSRGGSGFFFGFGR